MSLSVVEATNHQKANLLLGENYDLTLTQSIQNVIAESQKENPNFNNFLDLFYELMQSKIDPPLESIWVYSALTSRCRNSANEEPLNRLSVTKDQFQMISACSGSFSSPKSIALLAPVVFEVYKLVVELKGKDGGSKRDKKLVREVTSLINSVLGFISVCCCKNLNGQTDDGEVTALNLIVPTKALFSLWTDSLGSFLPLVNAEICGEISEGECDVNYLAGVIMVEAFLLKVCLNFRDGVEGANFEKELRSWVVGCIGSFQNVYFFDIILRLLLDQTLPVTSLLSSEDEILLRKVFYDAVILPDYSFLKPERSVHVPVERMKRLAITRLIVTHEAIELLRKNGDQKRPVSYASAFTSSKLPSQFTKWITNQISMDEKTSQSFGSSPKSILKCLLSLENQGIRVFDDRMLKHRAKQAVENFEAASNFGGKESSDSLVFYIDNKGENADIDEGEDGEQEKMNESMSVAFVAAAHSMKSTENNGGEKRKAMNSSSKKKKIKYIKHDISENQDATRTSFSSVDEQGSSSESEVVEPPSDEDEESKDL